MSGDLTRCPICNAEEGGCDHSDEERGAHVAALHQGREAPFNAGDEGQVETRSRSAKRREKQARKDFADVMNTPGGRRVMWALISRCGVFHSSFAKAKGDAAMTAFFEGERNVGIELITRATTETPASYALMVKENGDNPHA